MRRVRIWCITPTCENQNDSYSAPCSCQKGSIRARNKDDAAIVNTALTYFYQQGFVYTLEPPPLGANTVDDFLFTSKRGFCEHYASAFVFLMRAADIPARTANTHAEA